MGSIKVNKLLVECQIIDTPYCYLLTSDSHNSGFPSCFACQAARRSAAIRLARTETDSFSGAYLGRLGSSSRRIPINCRRP